MTLVVAVNLRTICVFPRPIRLAEMKVWLSMMGSIIAINVLTDEVDYRQDIKPLFAENCNSCHGAEAKSGLRLDICSLNMKGHLR